MTKRGVILGEVLAPVLVEQPGVLATLSRWRPRVQIPPGTLDGALVYAVMTAAPQAAGASSTLARATGRIAQLAEAAGLNPACIGSNPIPVTPR